MSVNSKMTAIADEIRVLSGTEDAMGLDAMAEHVGEANEDVATEAGLIEQIASALEGKAAGGSGGSGGGNVETITIKQDSMPEPGMTIHYINESMLLQSATVNRNSSFTIAKNTIFVVEHYIDNSYDGCQKICGTNMCSAFLAIK